MYIVIPDGVAARPRRTCFVFFLAILFTKGRITCMYIHMYAHVHVRICTVQSTDKIKSVYLGKERKERRKKKKRAFSLDFWGPWMYITRIWVDWVKTRRRGGWMDPRQRPSDHFYSGRNMGNGGLYSVSVVSQGRSFVEMRVWYFNFKHDVYSGIGTNTYNTYQKSK